MLSGYGFPLMQLCLIFKSYCVSLLPAEADAVLDGEFVGGLTGAGQGGGVAAVFEAAQVPRHCRKTRGEEKRLVTHNNLDAVSITCWLLAGHVQMSQLLDFFCHFMPLDPGFPLDPLQESD